MYVCICNGVTDHQIREAASHGCRTVAELTMRTGCGATCGSCLDTAVGILEAHAPRTAQEGSLFPILDLSRAA